jgi:ElaA protein
LFVLGKIRLHPSHTVAPELNFPATFPFSKYLAQIYPIKKMAESFQFNPVTAPDEATEALQDSSPASGKQNMQRSFIVKQFAELTTLELFEIYRLRSRVFVQEQNCAYQDVDEKDLLAHHVMMMDGDRMEGYSRILPPGASYPEPAIGRVLVDKGYRGKGTGKQLMEYSIHKARELFGGGAIVISAQQYLTRFYEQLGFTVEGETYWEDDIPHVRMRYGS